MTTPLIEIDEDILLIQMVPRKVPKAFVSNIDVQVRKTDTVPFTIQRAQARMNDVPIPITIMTNDNEVNMCELEIDTNNLPVGYKKLDIDIITSDNSNQFRRYIRVL
ncbi:MAG: hypothetical protein Q8M92_03810 [Candidatus Subteraquimicrobiales bacterium]|nr:hypothetical protein [Candidatus Subteraquimicrobiales bacterium]